MKGYVYGMIMCMVCNASRAMERPADQKSGSIRAQPSLDGWTDNLRMRPEVKLQKDGMKIFELSSENRALRNQIEKNKTSTE
jgi:hypothetical protein